MANRKKPSLYRQTTEKRSLFGKGDNGKPSLYPRSNNRQTYGNRSSYSRSTNRNRSPYGKSNKRRNSRQTRNGSSIDFYNLFSKIPNFSLNGLFKSRIIKILGIIVFLLLLISIIGMMTSNLSQDERAVPTSTLIGNNSLGTVYKVGPYGNASSDISIAYILGTHPREQGAHKKMEQAFNSKVDNLSYKYYLYKINVSSDSTDYDQSRINGQNLANEFVVPDAIDNNVTFAVDCHYSNGNWGVARFVFTPRENNTLSSQIGHALADNFDWLVYFTPSNPTSPQYLTAPLNDGGVASIIYEAYTEDAENVTIEHAKEMIDFIDNWNFTS